jgi:hypothetical protein
MNFSFFRHLDVVICDQQNAFAGFLDFLMYLPPMFETISAQLITAADKLSHLRRFL